ncbi:hypothetical protein SELR_pSRC400910 (plasmid) [Selenomonas ruminantium subsp. lactilytica TAM6421]|uniref:Uncharacterized protein n=1 Tax=Selenomonas ruminantium subsp. lactilytica (strain NBRC 103574 / TAM6421) TaxID=927704 RepID=I0GVF5_SELRL|nr:hypothetical protein SELR_pSRC400910 [Selenomonas ruminantium subsp. lactilytica TAM6421]
MSARKQRNWLKMHLHRPKRNRKATRVLCCGCGTIIRTHDNQIRKCKCGDITVFQYRRGFYDVAYRNNARYEILSDNRHGGRVGWLKDIKAGV